MLNIFFNGSEAEGRDNFKDLLKLGMQALFSTRYRINHYFTGPIVDMTAEIPFENLNDFKVRLSLFQPVSVLLTG